VSTLCDLARRPPRGAGQEDPADDDESGEHEQDREDDASDGEGEAQEDSDDDGGDQEGEHDTRLVPGAPGVKPASAGTQRLVTGRTQRRWERRGSWAVAGLVALAILVAALWLLPLGLG
jgi:hypothetical protein